MNDYSVFWAIICGVISSLFLYSTVDALRTGVTKYGGGSGSGRWKGHRRDQNPISFWFDVSFTTFSGICFFLAMLDLIGMKII